MFSYFAKHRRGLLFFQLKSQAKYSSKIASTNGTLLLLVGLDIKNTAYAYNIGSFLLNIVGYYVLRYGYYGLISDILCIFRKQLNQRVR